MRGRHNQVAVGFRIGMLPPTCLSRVLDLGSGQDPLYQPDLITAAC